MARGSAENPETARGATSSRFMTGAMAMPNVWVATTDPTAERVLAILACAALLYFAAGGSFLHQHTKGPDPACHICQALHMPTLAAAPLDLVSTPELVTWFSSLPLHAAPSDSFALHRAGRAPPSA